MGETRAGADRRVARDRALYVEIVIDAPLETIWSLTQTPEHHVRWDARFSAIRPTRVRADGSQEFRYELDLGFHTIRGTGVSLGERSSRSGERTSALAFDTADRWSPLGAGRGYWRYIPTAHGVRFLTGYDYAPGWGRLGSLLDPLVTRRFVWWLTARSFDRLRLWAEEGVPPERTVWWRALLPGRRPRARASRCLSRPPHRSGRAIMQNAPDALSGLAA
ncbi:SRPBCC family protein [Microbacterium sp. 179-I 3D4 NHS]|uniref:SRPBCC family protein n=1 Tax=Microbacterium sp. 179-I 3D4 NHS TaxID=3142381 RepID=UPI00399EEE6E